MQRKYNIEWIKGHILSNIITQCALCLASVNTGSRVWVYFPSSAELRRRCTISTGLCVLSLEWVAVGFYVITCERGEALYNDEKATQDVFLFIHWEATQMCAHALHTGALTYTRMHLQTHSSSLSEGKGGGGGLTCGGGRTGSNHGFEKHSSGLNNIPKICAEIFQTLSQNRFVHTTECIYADEHG